MTDHTAAGEAAAHDRQRSAKNEMAFSDMILAHLDGRKHLARINEQRRRNGQKPVAQDLIWDAGHGGLALLIGAKTKTFMCQFKFGGKHVLAAISRFGEGDVNPDPNKEYARVGKARATADSWRALAKQGIDPRKQGAKPDEATSPEAASPEGKTYRQVVDLFIAQAKNHQRTWDQTERVLTSCKAWLDRPIKAITEEGAYDLLDGFTSAGHHGKAAVTYRWLKVFFKWAWKRKHVDSPIIDRVDFKPVKGERDRVYSDAEIAATWQAAGLLDPDSAAFVKLLVLLAPRKTALAAMRRSHLDDPANPTIWTTPFELTKSKKSARKKRTYVTPLPPLAQRIFKGAMKCDGAASDRVFPSLRLRQTAGGQQYYDGDNLRRALVKHGAPKDIAFHAWRHTAATWLQNAGHLEPERDLVLDHSGRGSATAVYSHGYPLDLKRKLLTEWSDHVERIVAPEGAALLR